MCLSPSSLSFNLPNAASYARDMAILHCHAEGKLHVAIVHKTTSTHFVQSYIKFISNGHLETNHKASSPSCNYYKEALKIAVQLQDSIISQSQAAKKYASLYTKENTIIMASKSSTKLITASQNIDPSQISSQSQENST